MQATHQTPDDVLEAPVATAAPKGLVPRSGLFIALALFIFILVGFAFYDLVIKKPPVPGPQTDAAKGQMAVESLGKTPNLADIATMADQQAAKVPTPPLPAASMSAKIDPPGGAHQPNGGIPPNGPSASDQRSAEAAISGIFAIQGSEGAGRLASAIGLFGGSNPVAGAAEDQIATLQKVIDQKSLGIAGAAGGSDGGEGVQMIKALAQVQGQQANRLGKDQQFMKDIASQSASEATFARPPAYPWLVFQGTRIPIVVREAVNSDLPGSITAITTSPVYDSIQQCAILVPSGTRLVGTYSADVRPGQSRVLMVFSRMIFPDGRSLDLNGAQGVDQIGAVGKEGEVDNHFLKMFGYSFAIALLADNMSNRGASSITVGQNGQSTTTTIAGQVLGQISSGILSRNAVIPPTITLDVGSRLFITIVRDLALPPVTRTRCK